MSVSLSMCWTQCETKLCFRSLCRLCQSHGKLHTYTPTHMELSLADRRAWRVGNENRSSCMKAHISRTANPRQTHARALTRTHTRKQVLDRLLNTFLQHFLTLLPFILSYDFFDMLLYLSNISRVIRIIFTFLEDSNDSTVFSINPCPR